MAKSVNIAVSVGQFQWCDPFCCVCANATESKPKNKKSPLQSAVIFLTKLWLETILQVRKKARNNFFVVACTQEDS